MPKQIRWWHINVKRMTCGSNIEPEYKTPSRVKSFELGSSLMILTRLNREVKEIK